MHVGLHKTGTTYLQRALLANQAALRAAGVDFPGGDDGIEQHRSVSDLLGMRPRGYDDPRIDGAWDALVRAVGERNLPTAILSREHLALGSARSARRLAASFPDREISVVVTVRDLGRVLVSFWQQHIRDDHTWTWSEYVSAVQDPSLVDVNPARAFWGSQDLPRICATWEAAVPRDRLHIVTVPAPGAAPGTLLARFASVAGFDPGLVSQAPALGNENIGPASTEVIRQLNLRLGRRLNELAYVHLVRDTLVPVLAQRPGGTTPPVLPPEEVGWVTRRAAAMVATISRRGYPITGTLDDLEVTAAEGPRPDDAAVEEVTDTALRALAALATRPDAPWKADLPTGS